MILAINNSKGEKLNFFPKSEQKVNLFKKDTVHFKNNIRWTDFLVRIRNCL
jgi:hypothetical protein